MERETSTRSDAPKPRVLVVDDEIGVRELLEILLENEGYQVATAMDAQTAQAILTKETIDCILTDLRMGSKRDAGMELLKWVKANTPAIPAIMMTAYGSVETAIEAMKRGAVDYIMKPFKNDEVRLIIRRAIEQRDIVRENEALRRDQALRGRLENIIGSSAAIEEVREMIRRIAMLPTTVAIHGESGSGKELVARGIHHLSNRSDKPFVALNCGAFPESLLESELFGHKRGSFTGAVEDKEGLFVVASGGTLFLDEIGEMPLQLQVKLLRVLDNGVVMPVGGTSGISVDVRIISATNRSLERMAREGTFREDLFYRLNVIPIHVPSLRQRADDIPLLARHFIQNRGMRLGRAGIELTQEAEAALCRFNWPGNVRELENVVERAIALSDGRSLHLSDLPPYIQHYMPAIQEEAGERGAADLDQLPEQGLDLEAYVADIEIHLITQALQRAHYSQKNAAQLLRLTPRSLRYRLQKYGLES